MCKGKTLSPAAKYTPRSVCIPIHRVVIIEYVGSGKGFQMMGKEASLSLPGHELLEKRVGCSIENNCNGL